MPLTYKEIYIFDVAAGCESVNEEVEIEFLRGETEEEKRERVEIEYDVWLGNNINTAWWKK